MTRQTLLIAGLFLSSSVYAQTEVPNTFTAGTPARAAEVNENFDTLEAAVDQNATAITQIPAGPQGDVGPAGPQGLPGFNEANSVIEAQLLTARQLAAEARWLVVDYFAKYASWPADNAQAFAAPATNITNLFVASIEIQTAVVVVTMGNDADPVIAGHEFTFSATENGGFISWACAGNATIDAAVPDQFARVTMCTFFDPPPVELTTIRQQVLEGVNLIERFTEDIQSYYDTFATFPPDNASAGIPFANQIVGNYVTNVAVNNGVLTATYGNYANPNIAGDTLTYSPVDEGGGLLRFACANGSGLRDKWLPPHCL